MKIKYLLIVMQLIIHFLLIAASLNTSKASLIRKCLSKYAYTYADTTYRIVSAHGNTYGYEILIKNRVLIRQLTIPGKSGILGFKKKNDAEKVAQLVLRKLSKGLMPPTINDKEMKELEIKI